MTAWIDTFNGPRRSTLAWLDASQRTTDVGYGGPADGDFARYVEQLLAQAEHQRRPQHDAHVPTPAAADAGARRTAAPLRARAVAARAASAQLSPLRWPLALAIWLLLAVVLFFWQGTMVALAGLLIAGAIGFNAVRRALGGKKR
ncbi:MAG: hypothetical protein ABWY08_14290 [Comamonas sp.]